MPGLAEKFQHHASHAQMLDLSMVAFEGGWRVHIAVSLREAFPFLLPKPPMLLLPEIMLWTRTAGAASASLLPPLFLHSFSKF